jgi:TonB family protein
MKFRNSAFVVVAATLAALCQPPAQAFEKSVPSISLVPFASREVAAAGTFAGCNTAAAIDGSPYWDMPPIAQAQDVHGTASIKIDLTSSGALAAEQVYASSGDPVLDRAALKSARLTKFVPEKVNCERVAGSYEYDVDF